MPPKEREAAQIPIEVTAGWLSDMKASHASRTCVGTTRVQRATMLVIHDGVEQTVQFRLEHGPEPTQNEVAPCGSIDEETQMQRNQQFREGVSVDAGVNGGYPQETVRIGMDQLE